MCSKSPLKQEVETLPLDINYIPQFALEKCELELNETSERKAASLAELRSLLQENKTTSGINFHEDLLVQYLRHSKYRTKKAFQNLQNLMNLRKTHPRYFQSIPDEYFSSKPSTECLVVLPRRCPDGCSIVIFRNGKWDPSDLPFENLEQIISSVFLQIVRDPMTQINGCKVIHDFGGVNLQHLKYCTPYNVYLFYHCSMKCVPARYKTVHIINASFAFKAIWAFMRTLLTKKILSRVYIHSKVEDLLDHFPRSVLPVEYGGTLEDISTDWVRKANKEHQQYTVEGCSNFY